MKFKFPLILILLISTNAYCENDADRLDNFSLSFLYKYSIPLANFKSYIENNSVNGGELRLEATGSLAACFGVLFSWNSFTRVQSNDNREINNVIIAGESEENVFTQQVMAYARYYFKLQELNNIKLFAGGGLGLAASDNSIESSDRRVETISFDLSTNQEIGLRWDTGLKKLKADLGLDFNQVYNYDKNLPQILYLGIKLGVAVSF